MSNETPNPTYPRTAGLGQATRRGPGWAGTLILACLALGFCASAVELERSWGLGQQQRAELLATADSEVSGQLEDLGRFLADPQTRLIRLNLGNSSAVGSASVVWNASREKGYLLCDQLRMLDADAAYEVWARHGSEQPIRLAGIYPKSGQSVYPFRASGVKTRDRLEITAGPRSAGNAPIFTGEFD
jgi:hypothetical protein